MPPLLELRDVTKSIGGLTILNQLSLSLQPGEALGVLGPNGAGKTTMLNLIGGDMRPSAGHIFFAGQAVTHLPAHRRCRLGIARTYQIPQPFKGLTVYENTLVGATFGGRAARRAPAVCRDVLELTRLSSQRDVLAGNLRLLDRKRLEVARALATQPKLILLDEIGGGLTEGEFQDLLGMIAALRARGLTVVWIEHVVHALVSAVDRILAMNFGTKLIEGDPQSILTSKGFQDIYLGVE